VSPEWHRSIIGDSGAFDRREFSDGDLPTNVDPLLEMKQRRHCRRPWLGYAALRSGTTPFISRRHWRTPNG